jgi:hypothetical protein
MSSNNHTPLSNGAALDASVLNVPHGELDLAITKLQLGAETVALSSDVLTPTPAGGSGSRNYLVQAETGTADDLIEIAGTTIGEYHMLRADAGDTITIKHNDGGATNKIHCIGDVDKTLNEQNGMLFFQIASNVLVQVNEVAAPTSSVMTLLSGPTTLGSTSATIDLTSISAAHQDLILIISARGDTAATITDMNIRFNGDTGSNYSYNQDEISGGAASTVTSNDAQTDITVTSGLVASTATANYHSSLKLEIIDYTNTGKTRQGFINSTALIANTNIRTTESFFAWLNAANAIDQITLTPAAGNFDTGTVYSLYGRG